MPLQGPTNLNRLENKPESCAEKGKRPRQKHDKKKFGCPVHFFESKPDASGAEPWAKRLCGWGQPFKNQRLMPFRTHYQQIASTLYCGEHVTTAVNLPEGNFVAEYDRTARAQWGAPGADNRALRAKNAEAPGFCTQRFKGFALLSSAQRRFA